MFGAPATGDGFSIVFPLILTAPASFKLPPWNETAPRFFCSAAPPPGGVTVSRYPLFPVIVTGILLSASLVSGAGDGELRAEVQHARARAVFQERLCLAAVALKCQVVNCDRPRALVVLKERRGAAARRLDDLRALSEADGGPAAGNIRTRDGQRTGTGVVADYHGAVLRDIIVFNENRRVLVFGELQCPRKSQDRRIKVSAVSIACVICV